MRKPNEHVRRGTATPRAALLAATLGAVLLGGCSRGHVGESWQCPLATGGSCGSVAAVDPAVPDAGHGPVLDAPLWRKREDARDLPEATVCAGDCGDGSGPFGWLGRLFPDRHGQNDGRAREKENEPGNDAPDADAALSSAALSALPAEPDSVPESAGADDLRTDEVVARIWIAPFVDGDGVYREAGHVRVVLAPASWRTE
ncbi:MAG: TraV family lipoprotein [Boseongicola sp.]|nr:TraV family lipoprotein [Boseongicola sp.]